MGDKRLTYAFLSLLVIVNMNSFSVTGLYAGLGGAVWNFAIGSIFGWVILIRRKPNIMVRVNLGLLMRL